MFKATVKDVIVNYHEFIHILDIYTLEVYKSRPRVDGIGKT